MLMHGGAAATRASQVASVVYAWTSADADLRNACDTSATSKILIMVSKESRQCYCGQSESPHAGGRCKGCCAALPGDTVYWRANDWGYPESYKYEPATQEDLVERGYITTENGYTSVLTQQAKLARDDPSQLGESDDED
jgi:hypothetical protein